MSDGCAIEAALGQSERAVQQRSALRTLVVRYWGEAIIVALALLVWVPRLSGPIDLRWDGGVYYLLGTSLAQGHGYRIPSEPGSPEALQYPPLLPAVVALHQRALGTTNVDTVAPWLRKSYAMVFLIYAVAVLALARRYLAPGFAVTATALCLLQVETLFLSDLLFAELPFALVSVLLVLVAANEHSPLRGWLREIASFLLAAAGFLLRTAGLALLAAWVLEAVVRRRWRLAVVRGALALLPIIAWQTYVASVRASDEYAHPAYEYQRASYQYYNVSYADNVRLLDPFRPELGRMGLTTFAARLATNLPSLLESLGESISTVEKDWRRLLNKIQRHLVGRYVMPSATARLTVFGLSALVIGGFILLLKRREWLMLFIAVGSVGLVWATPWPAQYTRYLMPLAPFMAICFVLTISTINTAWRNRESGRPGTLRRVVIIGILVFTFATELWSSQMLFRVRFRHEAVVLPTGEGSYRLFDHDGLWRDWEEAGAWIKAHAPPDAIVSTSAPHLFYLRTGLRAILPPMEAAPERARQLLESVPVSYVIVDKLKFVDISRRYADPAAKSDHDTWRVVQSVHGTKIYQRGSAAQ